MVVEKYCCTASCSNALIWFERGDKNQTFSVTWKLECRKPVSPSCASYYDYGVSWKSKKNCLSLTWVTACSVTTVCWNRLSAQRLGRRKFNPASSGVWCHNGKRGKGQTDWAEDQSSSWHFVNGYYVTPPPQHLSTRLERYNQRKTSHSSCICLSCRQWNKWITAEEFGKNRRHLLPQICKLAVT